MVASCSSKPRCLSLVYALTCFGNTVLVYLEKSRKLHVAGMPDVVTNCTCDATRNIQAASSATMLDRIQNSLADLTMLIAASDISGSRPAAGWADQGHVKKGGEEWIGAADGLKRCQEDVMKLRAIQDKENRTQQTEHEKSKPLMQAVGLGVQDADGLSTGMTPNNSLDVAGGKHAQPRSESVGVEAREDAGFDVHVLLSPEGRRSEPLRPQAFSALAPSQHYLGISPRAKSCLYVVLLLLLSDLVCACLLSCLCADVCMLSHMSPLHATENSKHEGGSFYI